MSPTFIVLLLRLVLLIYAIDSTAAFFLNKRVQLPDTYTGNTPYKGLGFGSTNITVPLRTQRDIGLNVTIDRWLWPAIDLKAGYFGNDYSAQKLSHVEQIMYMGYRRLVVDLYWDPDRHAWQLCPDKLPTSSISRKSKRSKDNNNNNNDNNRAVHTSPPSTITAKSSRSSPRKSRNSNGANSLPTLSAGRTVNKLVPISQEDVNIGQYKCAPWYTFQHFMDSVNYYLIATDFSTAPADTNLLFLILNLHQLPSSNSNSNSNKGEDNESLRNIIQSAIDKTNHNSSRLYTPDDLIHDRHNLTASFGLNGEEGQQFTVDPVTGAITSDTAWPTFIYLMQRDVQLLVGFGSIDLPNDTNYNYLEQDRDIIFNSTQLGAGWYMNQVNLTNMEAMGWGDCARPANNTFVLPLENNETDVPSPTLQRPESDDNVLSWSWIYMNDGDNNVGFSYNTTLKAVQCGYSPYFLKNNYTDNKNADYSVNDTTHLSDNILGTIWSWDIGEPKLSRSPHCAMMQRWNGRWRTGDCTELLRVSCRHNNNPNKWILTQTYVSYDRAFSACPDDYVFDCPRIAQHNRMLFKELQKDLSQNAPQGDDMNDIFHHLFWINLNSGNNGSCWVIGLFSNCWWLTDNATLFQKLIRTSAVAGVIVLILVGIFTWIKCARWWRYRKARIRKNFIKDLLARREYTTVPA